MPHIRHFLNKTIFVDTVDLSDSEWSSNKYFYHSTLGITDLVPEPFLNQILSTKKSPTAKAPRNKTPHPHLHKGLKNLLPLGWHNVYQSTWIYIFQDKRYFIFFAQLLSVDSHGKKEHCIIKYIRRTLSPELQGLHNRLYVLFKLSSKAV